MKKKEAVLTFYKSTHMFCMVLQFYIPTHKYEWWENINNLLVKVLLEGVYDEGCVLSKLKGCPHILGMIWRDVTRNWLAQIQLPRIFTKKTVYVTVWR